MIEDKVEDSLESNSIVIERSMFVKCERCSGLGFVFSIGINDLTLCLSCRGYGSFDWVTAIIGRNRCRLPGGIRSVVRNFYKEKFGEEHIPEDSIVIERCKGFCNQEF